MYGVPFTKCLYEGADCERETAKGEEREKRLGDLEWHSECDCECDWVLGSAKTFSRSVLVSPMPTTTTTPTPSERDK